MNQPAHEYSGISTSTYAFFFVAHFVRRVFEAGHTSFEVFFGQPENSEVKCERQQDTCRTFAHLCTKIFNGLASQFVSRHELFHDASYSAPKIKMYPKKGSYQREVSSSNQHFPEDMPVFPGYTLFLMAG